MLRFFPLMGGRRNGVFQVTYADARLPSWQGTSRRNWLYRVISRCLNSIPPQRTNSSTSARRWDSHSKCCAAANNGTNNPRADGSSAGWNNVKHQQWRQFSSCPGSHRKLTHPFSENHHWPILGRKPVKAHLRTGCGRYCRPRNHRSMGFCTPFAEKGICIFRPSPADA